MTNSATDSATNSANSSALTYPFEAAPAFGSTKEVAPGVKWLQLPLPMSLNHINLYLIEEDEGWVVVDTGIRGEESRDLWLQVFDNELNGKPVTKVICTHMHPDHVGQAGFIAEHWGVPLYMSYSEYYQARTMMTTMKEGGGWQKSEYHTRSGFDDAFLDSLRAMGSNFAPEASDKPLPNSFIRLTDGDKLQLGKYEWEIITGTGHSPEHVCLHCPELRLLISGDQILPIITSNVSVHPTEPEANPMSGWLDSHERLKQLLPNDLLVLPAHNAPFYGVHERLQELIDHHEDRMLILEEQCVEAKPALELIPHLFARKLEGMTKIMAVGECVAHLHCLMSRNRIKRILEDNIYKYLSIAPDLASRARPGQHEAPEPEPNMI